MVHAVVMAVVALRDSLGQAGWNAREQVAELEGGWCHMSSLYLARSKFRLLPHKSLVQCA